MALTFTKKAGQPPAGVKLGRGNFVVWIGTITLDSSYPTNGEAVAASDFGFDTLLTVQVGAYTNVATKFAAWDGTNSKIKLYVEDSISGISAEAANASDQSAVVVNVVAFGTVSAA